MKLDRYSRQTILPEIGGEGQKKLSESSVLCIGAGGLGSPALLYLAGAGVGRIGIVDFDQVDETNLQRQVLYTTESVGQSKARQAQKKLQALNPHIRIEAFEETLTAANAPRLLHDYDIILDGTDNFSAKFLINDACVKYGKTLIYGAIQGFDGQVAIFDGKQGPCYRCLYPEPPQANIMNCAEAGVIGAIAGLVGATQALQAIEIIVGDKSFSPLLGKLWLIDGKTMQSRLLKISQKENCPACGQAKESIVLKDISAACQTVPLITLQEYGSLKEEHVLLDVREKHEWDAGHHKDAVHWPLSVMKEGRLPNFSTDKKIIIYCQKGMRSLEAGRILQKEGYANVSSLMSGYDALIRHS